MRINSMMLSVLLSFAAVSGNRIAAPAQLAADPATSVSVAPVARGQRIFSTGHSFHFGFPAILDEIAKSAGYKDNEIVGISSIGGSIVAQHVAGAKVQEALKGGHVDVLMTTPIYLPDPGIEEFADIGIAHNPEFRMTVMEFWLPFDQYEPRNYSHGPAGSPTEHLDPPPTVDHNAMTGDQLRKIHKRYFDEMDRQVTDVNRKIGKQVIFVVPCGQAVIALREKIIDGQAPGLKSQWDLFADNLGHPKPPLKVLMGWCHYAVIYRRNPIGLPVPKELGTGKEAEDLNRMLQGLAWDAVSHHPLSGVPDVRARAAIKDTNLSQSL